MSGEGDYDELFILSPPHAGTTAMAKLLLGSPRIWSRIDNAEGQKIPESAPHLGQHFWSRKHPPNWPALKSIWEEGRPDGAILLEKSPPILAHPKGLLETWPRGFFVISMRSPYALVASYLQRRGASEEEVRKAVTRWTVRARMQRRNTQHLEGRSLVTTYEAFARQPEELVRALEQVFGPLAIEADRPLEVKHYAPAPISDHNARQIATLSEDHLALARERLAIEASEEMAFWGY